MPFSFKSDIGPLDSHRASFRWTTNGPPNEPHTSGPECSTGHQVEAHLKDRPLKKQVQIRQSLSDTKTPRSPSSVSPAGLPRGGNEAKVEVESTRPQLGVGMLLEFWSNV